MPRRNNGSVWDPTTQSFTQPSRARKRRKAKSRKYAERQRQARAAEDQ